MEDSTVNCSKKSIDPTNTPLLAIAKYEFEGQNNDELSFQTNDVITVIQQLDGGWWEGTLDGRVGWFPSNFVGVIKATSDSNARNVFRPEVIDVDYEKQRREILSIHIAKEKEHIKMLEKILKEFVSELQTSKSEINIAALQSNIPEILAFTKMLLDDVEEDTAKSLFQQQIGKIFIDAAPQFFNLLKDYCENYSSSIRLINSKSDLIHQIFLRANIQLNELIICLSMIYRHSSKYSATLQEVERNTPDSHPDRGNLQRACLVYRDFYAFCEDIRRQREAQEEFLSTGAISSNFGSNFKSKLGKFYYVGNITTIVNSGQYSNERVFDRCIAIFNRLTLLFEHVSTENVYLLMNSLPNENLEVLKNDRNLSFELRTSDSSPLMLKAPTSDELQKISDVYSLCAKSVVIQKQQNIEELDNSDDTNYIDSSTKWNSTKQKSLSSSSGTLRLNHQLQMILPEGNETNATSSSLDPHTKGDRNSNRLSESYIRVGSRGKLYSGWCLRPLPPSRTEFNAENLPLIKMRKENVCLDEYAEDDALMLKIIEGYFTSTNSTSISLHSNERNSCCNHYHTQKSFGDRHSADGACFSHGTMRRAASYPAEDSHPQLIVAEDEKLLVEELEGDQVVIKERTLVDTVYSIRDQLTNLQLEFSTVMNTLESEQKARRRLEEQFRQRFGGNQSPSVTAHSKQSSSSANLNGFPN